MVSLADSLVTAGSRPLAMRRRADLHIVPQWFEGRRWWILKDPLAFRYHRLQDGEYALWRMVDGHTSLEQLQSRFAHQFPPERPSLESLQQLLGSFHQAGLVVSTAPGQGHILLEQAVKERWQQRLAMLLNPLTIRFRGFDPERLLTWLYPRLAWCFSTWCVSACLLLILAALVLVAVQFDTFAARLPTFQQFFTPANALWLSAALGLVKVVHEFGHGLTCKHYGGECHEMGLMLLIFTPCLYCDVTDDWMVVSKWRRAAIAAAGVYVELVLAAMATFVWWFSEPGFLHYAALNVMFVSSVSTVLFNGNPLMKYDGYYVLSHLLEKPNLRQQASHALARAAGEHGLGLESPDDPFAPRHGQVWFALFAVACAVYQWFVTFSILWFLNKFFEPYGLDVIGQTLAGIALVSLVVLPAWRVVKFFWVPGRMSQVKRSRLIRTLVVSGLALAAFFWLPWPQHVYTTLVVEPRYAEPVYVQSAGELRETLVSTGDRVRSGQPLARLVDPALELSLAQLTSERDEQAGRLETLYRQRFREAGIAQQIPQAEEALRGVEERLARRQEDAARLTLVAPRGGTVLPPPRTPRRSVVENQLPKWHGTPVEAQVRGAFLEAGTLFCLIGENDRLEAVLVIDQADVEFVAVDQPVEILLEHLPGKPLEGRVAEVAREELTALPQQLSGKAGGQVATESDAAGKERPLSASYQVRVPLEQHPELIRPGLRGRAKIRVGTQTLAAWVWRYFTQTFHFQL